MTTLCLEHALLPSGWADAVRVEIVDGTVTAVTPNTVQGGAELLAGFAIPGVPNLHSHAFQRGMAGLTEIRGPGDDSFWTWRDVMYRFLRRLEPPAVEGISAYAYMRMLEAGYTAVGEFHYLHHDPAGHAYADPAELCGRIVQAAAATGITLTLLPCFYRHGGFDAAPATPGQLRFINDPDGFLRLLEAARGHLGLLAGARLGIAPHSLRAVTPADLRTLLAAVPDGPVHIHAAEQTREVSECRAALGARPVAWLLGEAGVGPRWCVVHATHMDEDETVALAGSGAVAGLCPLTEADLGDGIFPGKRFIEAGGRFGIGSDSNVITDPAAELRQLETTQRLALRSRNILASAPGSSTGAALLAGALAGGARALDQPIGAIAPGQRADIVVLDGEHPDLAGRGGDAVLDTWVLAAPRGLVRDVIAGGRHVVRDGRHVEAVPIIAAWRRAMAGLTGLDRPDGARQHPRHAEWEHSMIDRRRLLLAAGALITLAAAPEGEGLLAKLTSGKRPLLVGTDATFPPFEQTSPDGGKSGFDIDLVGAIAKHAGIPKVEFQQVPFGQLIPGLQADHIDLAASAIYITDARAKVVDFSQPYFTGGLAVMVKPDDDKITKADDLDGKTIAVQVGTKSVDYLRQRFPKASLHIVQTNDQMFQSLQSGQADVVVTGYPAAKYYIKVHGGAKLTPFLLTNEQYGLAIRKTDPDLLAAVNAAIEAFKTDGTMKALEAKWFG